MESILCVGAFLQNQLQVNCLNKYVVIVERTVFENLGIWGTSETRYFKMVEK
jgi:hypothetical protein